MIPFAVTVITDNPLSSSNNNISMSWGYTSSLNYDNFILTGSVYGAPISGTISEFLQIPYAQSKKIKWISIPTNGPGPAKPLFSLSSTLGFYNKLTDLSLYRLQNSNFTCNSNQNLNNFSIIDCYNIEQVNLSKNPTLNSIYVKNCTKLKNYITTSVAGNYSTFYTYYYVGSVSQSYLSGSCNTSSIFVSGSSQFTSTNYNGYVSGTYNNGIEITSSLVNYNGPITGTVSGNISGPFDGIFLFTSGSLNKFTGSLNGYLNGTHYKYVPAVNTNACTDLQYLSIDGSSNIYKIDVSDNLNLNTLLLNNCLYLKNLIGLENLLNLSNLKIKNSSYIEWGSLNTNNLSSLTDLTIQNTNITNFNMSNMLQLTNVTMSSNDYLVQLTSSSEYLNLKTLNLSDSILNSGSINNLYTNLSSSMKNNFVERQSGYLSLRGDCATTSNSINGRNFLRSASLWNVNHTVLNQDDQRQCFINLSGSYFSNWNTVKTTLSSNVNSNLGIYSKTLTDDEKTAVVTVINTLKNTGNTSDANFSVELHYVKVNGIIYDVAIESTCNAVTGPPPTLNYYEIYVVYPTIGNYWGRGINNLYYH